MAKAGGVKAWSIFGEVGLAGLGPAATKLRAFDAMGRKTAANMGGLEGSALAAGTAIGIMGIAVAVAVGKATMNFVRFEDSMTKSLAIMGDISGPMRRKMERAALRVGATTEFSATQAAEAYFFLASAGLSATASLAAMPAVARFAQAGNFDLARATDLLTDAQSALGLVIRDDAVKNMKNMIHVSDILVKANTLANASVEQFSEALTNKLGARLRLLNIPLEQGAALLSVLADQGVKASLAGERLNILLRDMPEAAARNGKAWEDLGIKVFDAEGNLNNIFDILEQVSSAFGKMSDRQKAVASRQLGMNKRSADSINLFIGTADALRAYHEELQTAADITQEVSDKQLTSISAKMKILRGEWEEGTQGVGRFGGSLLTLAVGAGTAAIQTINILTGAIQSLRIAASDIESDAVFTNFGFTDEGFAKARLARQVLAELELQGGDLLKQFEDAAPATESWIVSWRKVIEAADDVDEAIALMSRAIGGRYSATLPELPELPEELTTANAPIVFLDPAALAGLREAVRLGSQIGLSLSAEEIALASRLEKEAEEALAISEARVEAEIALGIRSRQEALARINEKIADEELGSARRLELIKERERIRATIVMEAAEAEKEADREREQHLEDLIRKLAVLGELQRRDLQLQLRRGEVTFDRVLDDLNRRIEIERQQGFLTARLISLEGEKLSMIERSTQQQIVAAMALATTNKLAAIETLTTWMSTLQQVGELTPAMLEDIRKAMTSIGQTGVETASEFSPLFQSIGQQFAQSLAAGVLDFEAVLATALQFVINLGLKKITGPGGLNIGSPSKVGVEIGATIPQGMALGIVRDAHLVQDAMQSLIPGPLDLGMRRDAEAITAALQQSYGAPQLRGVGGGPGRIESLARGEGGALPVRGSFQLDFTNLPAPRTPFDLVRDGEWQQILRESIIEAESQGFRGFRN